ncbi:maleate cis-trans isomerase family protein [Chachezhania sediminis]|uniref:maleate cis-trans isomerase family protein n=1 Tax=Chachezhania sediminis TaxID=2599291 RepID=UPI00131BC37B|nr:aspartate/glutamate racemase family protein [Chachezhania sediminis]
MTRLGLLVPSSNVVLEPLAAKVAGLSVHVTRLGVLDVALGDVSRAQFALDTQVAAAKLLCDAKVDRIVWGGTSASWLGLDHDLAFVARMEEETGVPTSTTVLQINRRLRDLGARRIGMVTPYTADVAQQINRVYEGLGFEIGAWSADGGDLSLDFASIPPDVVEAMVRQVAAAGVDAIVIMCTNVAGDQVADRLSAVLGVPVIDSAAATLA